MSQIFQVLLMLNLIICNWANCEAFDFNYSKNSQIDEIFFSIDVTKIEVDEERAEISQASKESQVLSYTVMRNYGMNQNFADINPERDFQLFNDEKNSHLQTRIS